MNKSPQHCVGSGVRKPFSYFIFLVGVVALLSARNSYAGIPSSLEIILLKGSKGSDLSFILVFGFGRFFHIQPQYSLLQKTTSFMQQQQQYNCTL